MSIETIIAGVRLKNPTMNASGVTFTMPPLLNRLQKSEVGAVVTKTATKNPREGNKGPSVLQFSSDIWMNRMGLPNPGISKTIEELKEYDWNVPIVVSIGGSSLSEYFNNSKNIDIGELIELNLSCPNVSGGIICFDLNQTLNITSSIKNNVNLPVFAKLSPYTDIEKLKKTIDTLYKAEIDGITLTNTAPSLEIISILLPVNEKISNNLFKGGESGKALFGLSLRNVYEAAKYIEKNELGMDIIGVGGIETSDDVIKYILCGAKAIQFGSAAAGLYNENNLSSFEIPKKLCKGLENYMLKNDFKSIEEFRGEAYK